MKQPLVRVLVLGLAFAAPVAAQERESVREARVNEILQKCDGAPVSQLWALSDTLVEMGAPARRYIMKAVPGTSAEGKLCALRALIELNSETFAAERLMELAADEAAEADNRLLALELIGHSEEPDAEDGLLELMFALDPEIRLAAARALWRLPTPRRSKAKQVFREFLKSADPDLRAEGALALAEIGDGRQPGVREVLRGLAGEPGMRGKLAQTLITKLMLEDLVARLESRLENGGGDNPGTGSGEWAHLDEIKEWLHKYYDLPNVIDDDKLRESAARGMLTIPGDAHTSFLSPEEHTQWNEDMDPSYGGIGALIDTNAKDFRILRPFFGGPAWTTDIRTGDQIVAVDGKRTLGRDTTEIIREIKGPPGTEVVLTIYRDGWDKTKDIKVVRAKIVLPTVTSRMLPGKIGLIEISNFGEDTGSQFRNQLEALEKDGITGLVIDVRWNPGGSLETVKQSLTPFLRKNELICTVKGRVMKEPRTHLSGTPGRERAYPISVLINSRSASGAELLSGVLQHYSKTSKKGLAEDPYLDAIVLGSPSFGKGTVQFKIPLDSWPGEKFRDRPRKNGEWDPGERLTVDRNGNGDWDPGDKFIDLPRRNGRWDESEPWDDKNKNGKWDPGEIFEDRNNDGKWDPAETYEDENKNGQYDYGAAIRLTVARYYLPSGKNFTRTRVERDGEFVYEGGVVPDIEVEYNAMKASSRAEVMELQQKNILSDYVRARWKKHRDRFIELAYDDGRDPSRYPDFDAFHESLRTRLTKQELRRGLRIEVRRAAANDLGKEIRGDTSDDTVLRRAILEILDRQGVDPKTIPTYADLAEDATAKK